MIREQYKKTGEARFIKNLAFEKRGNSRILCNLMLVLRYANLTNNAINARLPSIVPQVIPTVTISRSVFDT